MHRAVNLTFHFGTVPQKVSQQQVQKKAVQHQPRLKGKFQNVPSFLSLVSEEVRFPPIGRVLWVCEVSVPVVLVNVLWISLEPKNHSWECHLECDVIYPDRDQDQIDDVALKNQETRKMKQSELVCRSSHATIRHNTLAVKLHILAVNCGEFL